MEGVLTTPQGLSGSLPGVVVCHPHPHLGGSMESSVVTSLCQALVVQGFMAFRFNFRGVGGSEGAFTNGQLEGEDVGAAISFLRQWPQVDKKRLGAAGFSFGAAMLLTGLPKYRFARAFGLVSPRPGSLDYPGVRVHRRPKLVVAGERDRLVPRSALEEKVGAIPSGIELSLVPGADHSWRGYEVEVAGLLAGFFAIAL